MSTCVAGIDVVKCDNESIGTCEMMQKRRQEVATAPREPGEPISATFQQRRAKLRGAPLAHFPLPFRASVGNKADDDAIVDGFRQTR